MDGAAARPADVRDDSFELCRWQMDFCAGSFVFEAQLFLDDFDSGEFGNSRLFQVLYVCDGRGQCGRPIFGRGAVYRSAGSVAGGHFLLHFPGDELYGGCWRGDAPPVKNFATFACYVSLFPQLVAGPIVRYNTVAEELDSRKHSWENWMRGMTYFCLGFAKKILIANQVGVIADRVFEADSPGILNAWWGSLAYMMQIYFDFSAYSDMAVGLGLMLGFHFPRNFNGPYRSGSISEFWSRWHISLTTWLKDYLYIPLGGNRVARWRVYLNLFLVMFASGVWHGAAMTFICWGLYHAFFMIVERVNGKRALYFKFPRLAQVLLTQVIVLFGWVLFRAADISSALKMWKSMLGLSAVNPADPILFAEVFTPTSVVFMLLALVYAFSPIRAFEWCQKISVPRLVTAFALFAFAVLALFTQTYNPFLYFQF